MTRSAFEDRHLSTPDGARIAYRVRPGRSPWVLLHALGCDASLWGAVVDAMPSDLGLLIVELRGHGGSTLGWRAPSVDLWAEDVVSVVRAEGIERPGVAGLSMGGYVSLAIAARAPGLARAFALVSTSAAPDDEEGRSRRAAGLALLHERGWRAYLDAQSPLLLAPGRPDNDRNAAHLATMFARAGGTGLASALYALAVRPDRLSMLRWVDAPSIVVVGEADAVTPPERAREAARALPRAELRILPGVGHMSALEDPEAVAAALRD